MSKIILRSSQTCLPVCVCLFLLMTDDVKKYSGKISIKIVLSVSIIFLFYKKNQCQYLITFLIKRRYVNSFLLNKRRLFIPVKY
jgi:hypothetical protein